MASIADDSKDVLDKIKAEGTFDEMRVRVTEAVKRTVRFCNPGLSRHHGRNSRATTGMVQDTITSQVQQLVAQSDVFKSGKADSLSRKELFDTIRKSCEWVTCCCGQQHCLSSVLETVSLRQVAWCRKQLLEIAATATWEVLMNDSYGISQQVEQSTHEALCAVYEQREQQRVVLHHQQQQRHQQDLQQYNAYYALQYSQEYV